MSTPLILGHRGYSGKHPENTMRAFQKAIECGADGIECDLQKTKDGRFIVMHDETLDRTTTGRGRIDQLMWPEISQLKCAENESIPTLESLLEWMPKEKVINLEIKSGTMKIEDLGTLFSEVIRLRGTSNVIISSFEHSWLGPAKRAGFETGMLFGDEDKGKGPIRLVQSVLEIKPSYLHLPVQMFEVLGSIPSKILLGAFAALGNRFNFWTVNTQFEFEKVRRISKMIITDHVEKAREWST